MTLDYPASFLLAVEIIVRAGSVLQYEENICLTVEHFSLCIAFHRFIGPPEPENHCVLVPVCLPVMSRRTGQR